MAQLLGCLAAHPDDLVGDQLTQVLGLGLGLGAASVGALVDAGGGRLGLLEHDAGLLVRLLPAGGRLALGVGDRRRGGVVELRGPAVGLGQLVAQPSVRRAITPSTRRLTMLRWARESAWPASRIACASAAAAASTDSTVPFAHAVSSAARDSSPSASARARESSSSASSRARRTTASASASLDSDSFSASTRNRSASCSAASRSASASAVALLSCSRTS